VGTRASFLSVGQCFFYQIVIDILGFGGRMYRQRGAGENWKNGEIISRDFGGINRLIILALNGIAGVSRVSIV